MKNTFELNGTTYSETEKGYYFKTTGKKDAKGNDVTMRIGKAVYEKAFDEYIAQAADLAKKTEEQKDRETEQNFNGKKTGYTRKEVNEAVDRAIEKETKKAAKPRRSKDVAFELGYFTLTAKQVDFIKRLPNSNFWEDGLDSCLWCDILADELGGQFEGKPMTIGAMISTLREKGLIKVGQDRINGKKAKCIWLTEKGKGIAEELGLK